MQHIADAIVATMREPILVLEPDLRVCFANPAYQALFAGEEPVGRRLADVGGGRWASPALRQALEALRDGGDVHDVRVVHEFATLGRRVLALNARTLQPGPEPRRILLSIIDATESEDLRREVAARAEFGAKLIDSTREALLVLDPELTVLDANRPFYDIFQVEPSEVLGKPIYRVGNGQWDIPALRHALEEILPSDSAFDDFEVGGDFAAIGRRTMLLNGRRLDHMPRILLAIRDITDMRQQEADLRSLLGELQHRVKNILANVQATATATLRRSRSLEEFEVAFLQRLGAMARTQDALMRAPSGRADIRDLVQTEMQAHGREGDARLSLAGPEMTLSPRRAQVLATVLHELTTNALRHGAFSQPGGRVELTWSVEPEDGRDHLRFVWQETGVALDGPPPQKGFGSRLIERSVDYSLGGSSRLEFARGGVVWTASIPLGEARDRS